MDLQSYLTTLRRGWLLLVVMAILGAGAGTAAYVLTPKSYATTIDFYVSTPTAGNNSPQASGQFAEARVNSYILLLSSEQMGARVAQATGVQLTPAQIAQRVTATAKLNTVVVSTTVTDSDRNRSLLIAQGLDKTFGTMVNELDNAGRSTPVVVIHTVSGPTLASGPVSPDPRVYVGGGLLLGLAVGVAGAILGSAALARRAGREKQGSPAPTAVGPVPAERPRNKVAAAGQR